jgi:hypothetical protein
MLLGTSTLSPREDIEMRRDGNVTSLRRVTAFFAASMLASVNPALADGKTIAISGDSVPSDCAAPKKPDAGQELTGNLTGCLAIFIRHTNCRELNGFAFYTELGREEFEGKLNGKPIKFDTQYTAILTFPTGSCPVSDYVKEITGGCIHYVSGEDIGGVFNLYDVMPIVGQGATHFFYEGFLTRD